MISNLFPPDARGGAEWVAHDLAHALAARGHEIHVLTRRDDSGAMASETPGPVEVRRILRFHGAPSRAPIARIHHLVTEEYYDRENAELVRREIRAFRPDLIYMNAPTGLSHAPLWVAGESGRPVLIHIHDLWLADFLSHNRLGSVNRKLFRHFMTGPWRIVAVSRRLAAITIGAGLEQSRTVAVHNGIPPGHGIFSGNSTNTPIDEPRIPRALFCSRITRAKGLHVAAAAGIPLDVYGKGDEEYLARCLEIGAGQLSYKGHVPRSEVAGLLGRYAVLVLPSLWEEPCPLIVLEAMAAGCVPVVTRMGGMPELIEISDHEAAGVIINPDDAAALGGEVSKLLANDESRKRLSLTAQRHVNLNFGWETFVERMEAQCAFLIG